MLYISQVMMLPKMSAYASISIYGRLVRGSSEYAAAAHACELSKRCSQISIDYSAEQDRLTNLAAMSISILLAKPQMVVPIAANQTAVWFAARRPIMLHKRPYKGVNVQVAKR